MPRPIPPYCGLALGITSQDWSQLGLGTDPNVVASNDLDVTVDRITSLLLIRIVAWMQPRGKYTDLSTTTICRESLIKSESWPVTLTSDVIHQLRNYCKVIMEGYQSNPYHNFEHGYHVVISTNKLLDLILHTQDIPIDQRPKTFGLKDDPLMQFALLFAAVIHDVEHQGIPNRQLTNEDDILAIQYNDTSIAEHRSLYVAFSELLKDDYQLLRDHVFPVKEDYRRFRKTVIELVLTTDIASPERTQVSKSKWKEAFGDPYETVERKVFKKLEAQRRASLASKSAAAGRGGTGGTPAVAAATPTPTQPPRTQNRRMSTHSIMSELTLESPMIDVDTGDDDLDDDESVSCSPSSSEVGSDTEENTNVRQAGVGFGTLQRKKALQPPKDGGPIFRPPVSAGDDNLSNYIQQTSGRGMGLLGNAAGEGSGDGIGEIQEDEDEDYAGGTGTGDYGVTSTNHPPPRIASTPPPATGSARKVAAMNRRFQQQQGPSRPARTQSMDVSFNHNSSDMQSVGSQGAAGGINGMAMKFHRRLSSYSGANPGGGAMRRNHRLGLLRTVDLSGEAIETYDNHSIVRQSASGSMVHYRPSPEDNVAPTEEVDALREAVIMETIIKAADVAHNLQGWEQMEKWSNRLFLELRRAYVQGRGDNPQNGWFSNQLGFLEAYLLPLARALDDTGVFGDTVGAMFARTVEENRDRWGRDGIQTTAAIINEAEKRFPSQDEDDEDDE